MPVIDCHTHLFPPEIIRERAKIAARDPQFGAIYSDPKGRMVDAEGITAYMDREQIDTVIVCGFPFRDHGLIRLANDYILDAGKSDERIVPFIMVNAGDEAAALEEAQRCFECGARGIGELAFYDKGFGRKERFALKAVAQYAGESGMILMLHVNEQIGHRYTGKTEMDFPEVVRFVEDHPALDIILAHLGGGLSFYEFMPEIRKAFARVWYDIAALPFLYSTDVYRFLAQFIADKTLFGSDFPLLSLKRYQAGLDSIDSSARDKILFGNAKRLLMPHHR